MIRVIVTIKHDGSESTYIEDSQGDMVLAPLFRAVNRVVAARSHEVSRLQQAMKAINDFMTTVGHGK